MLRWTPHPVIVTIGDNKDYTRVLLYSYCTTITGWGVFCVVAHMVQDEFPKASSSLTAQLFLPASACSFANFFRANSSAHALSDALNWDQRCRMQLVAVVYLPS